VGGCTNCAGKSGCDDRKGTMLEQVARALARLYPSRRWGEPDDEARFGAGICAHDGEALAEELAAALEASTLFRPGDEDEYCDYIYVLCMGREPSLVQVRDAGVPLPVELADAGAPAGEPVEELYLRLCLSAMARMAAVQQVSLSLVRDGATRAIEERPRPGVYDPPLLHRFRRLVAILPAYDIAHLDFGEISAPPPGFEPGDYAARYGGEPHVANYLFYPQPTTMRRTLLIDPASS
jgi:hypothetical protein